ncbi:hypothetical protein [Rickettsia endosymbiont of Aspidapion aeneum]
MLFFPGLPRRDYVPPRNDGVRSSHATTLVPTRNDGHIDFYFLS